MLEFHNNQVQSEANQLRASAGALDPLDNEYRESDYQDAIGGTRLIGCLLMALAVILIGGLSAYLWWKP